MTKTFKLTFFFFLLYTLFGCKVQRVFLDNGLPDEDRLPKQFYENINKYKNIHYKYSDSISLLIINKHESYIFHKLENEKEYISLGDVKYWVVFNYKSGIQELIKRLTDTKEVGLVGSVNLVINYRVENGDMILEPGEVIDDDLFRVYGRANYLLKEITGEDFGSADMYATDKELIKLQRKWIRWYNRLCEKK